MESFMDQIQIKDLEVYGHHGVMKEENILGQKFLVSVILFTDTRKAGETDCLEHSVDYGSVAGFINEYMQNHTFQLIERVAEMLARELLLHFSLVRKIQIEIKKPWAPILLPMDTVSVKIKRKWHSVFLGIGSNMGDKEKNLEQAIQLLQQEDCQVVKKSKYRITEPVGEVEQDDFLNGAIELRTLLTPEQLLERIGEIEEELHRVRVVHWGPRTIDLDILLYDQEIIGTQHLQIPHKEMHKRRFVLEPMAEIAPYLMHPILNKTMEELYEAIMQAS